ncbi:MAG TPA: GDSL-type esterase/lipase family protein [Candidatus Saccharimonadales bacterium]|nr:GDSL-type esterase/lipase family protein [Candidatus Saccharimonadales bacterium]
MKHVFLFGASYVHGVGGPQGGWADKIKVSLHRDMYGEDATGETCEVYELGVPGASTEESIKRFEPELQARLTANSSRDDTIIVLQNGANDSKAVDSPEAYVSTPEAFAKNVQAMLAIAQKYAAHVIVLGLPPFDERKVRPKHNPITGKDSYFSNARLKAFEDVWKQACQSADVLFIPLYDTVPETWTDRYLYIDGVHPNDAGHQWIANQLEPHLRERLGDLYD